MSSSVRLKLFWWIVETSFSSSRCAGIRIAAAGHLVDVADLEPDDPVLDVVDDADAVAGAELGDPLDQLDEPEALAVERDRAAGLEPDPHRLAARRAPARAG